MKTLFSFFLLCISLISRSQCEDLSLKQEAAMTENIAIVKAIEINKDSVSVEVVKKWKGDSIADLVKFELEDALSKDFRVDTGKTYMLFWYNDLDVDRCSRSSEYKYVHFEYELDDILPKYKVVNVPLYDTIQYQRRNTFMVEGKRYDIKKGKYAFYDVSSGEKKAFSELPKETSSYYPLRFYVVDKNVETANKKYDLVFAVVKSHNEFELTKAVKKKALQSLFKN